MFHGCVCVGGEDARVQRCGHKRVQEARAVICILALPHPGMSGRRWESVWTPLPPTPFTQQVPRPCGFSLSNLPPLCADFVFLFLSFYCRRCLPGRPLSSREASDPLSTLPPETAWGRRIHPFHTPSTVACGHRGTAQIPHHCLGSTVRRTSAQIPALSLHVGWAALLTWAG